MTINDQICKQIKMHMQIKVATVMLVWINIKEAMIPTNAFINLYYLFCQLL